MANSVSKKCIFWHFNKLTNWNISLINDISKEATKMINFIPSKKKVEIGDAKEELELKLLQHLSVYFNEALDDFFLSVQMRIVFFLILKSPTNYF